MRSRLGKIHQGVHSIARCATIWRELRTAEDVELHGIAVASAACRKWRRFPDLLCVPARASIAKRVWKRLTDRNRTGFA